MKKYSFWKVCLTKPFICPQRREWTDSLKLAGLLLLGILMNQAGWLIDWLLDWLIELLKRFETLLSTQWVRDIMGFIWTEKYQSNSWFCLKQPPPPKVRKQVYRSQCKWYLQVRGVMENFLLWDCTLPVSKCGGHRHVWLVWGPSGYLGLIFHNI